MSSYYTLFLRSELKSSISARDLGCIHYLLKGGAKGDLGWPAHRYFEKVVDPMPVTEEYSGFGRGRYTSEVWVGDGECQGISLVLPSIKTDDDFWEHLLLADWICSLIDGDRAIGMLLDGPSPEDSRILFAVGGKLKMHWSSGGGEMQGAQLVNP